MELPNRNYAFTHGLARALADLGLRHVVVSPGSRNTPLSMAFADEPRISDWSVHDERSASFFAIGLAKPSQAPVALVCTSGTAAAEYHPAVVEAAHSELPLLVFTADRPPELTDVGAPQAIDQVALYGSGVKWFHDAGVPDSAGMATRAVPSLAAHAWSVATEPPLGPVHVNVRFREPLVPTPVAEDVVTAAPPTPTLPATSAVHALPDEVLAALDDKRVLVVVGPLPDPGLPSLVSTAAAAAGWPTVADPPSGLRTGTHLMDAVIAHGDLMARAGMFDRLKPDIVIRIGAIPTSKAVWTWLEENRAVPQWVIGSGRWNDSLATASRVLRMDAAALAGALGQIRPAFPDWAAAWRHADDVAGVALEKALGNESFPTEPAVAVTTLATMPEPATLWVGSSMPVRDLDTFGGTRQAGIKVLGHRGANGIDGLLSAAAGTAALGSGPGSGATSPVVVLAGDLSTLHDITALVTIGRLGLDVTVVVVNNDGGGIFHFLEQHRHRHFERHFATPHGLSFERLAEAFGVPARRIHTAAELTTGLNEGGPRLLEVVTDRVKNVMVHERLVAAVAAALD